MTEFDRRLTPARPGLAAAHLKGKVAAERYVEGQPARVEVAILPMAPSRLMHAARDTELLYGETVQVYDEQGGFAFVQADRDGYVGYVIASVLRRPEKPATHRVAVPRTHLYPGPNIKLPPTFLLPMNARVTVERFSNEFAVTDTGAHLIAAHLKPADEPEADAVAVAESFLGTPYLWAGRTCMGIDCSGLVQTSLQAAGIAAPRDTDMQEKALGQPVSAPKRGDLVFWKGHIGLMASDTDLIHANGHHMMVVKEPLAEAVARIRARGQAAGTGTGEITSIRRL